MKLVLLCSWIKGWGHFNFFSSIPGDIWATSFFTGVNDTSEKFFTDVIDTDEKFLKKTVIFTCVKDNGKNTGRY